MGSGQVLDAASAHTTTLHFRTNFYFFLGKANFFFFPYQLPVEQGSIGSIGFTWSSLSHDLKIYPFWRYPLSITSEGRTQTFLSAEAREMQKTCLIPLQMNCSKHIFSYLCNSTRKVNVTANTPFHGTRVICNRCLCCKIILGKPRVL